MPTYDYRCDHCNHEFEQFQSISASPLRKCPECGKMKLKRLIGTGAGVIFKGSGFYETDYRSESYKKAAEAEKKPADNGKSEKQGDSKTESKADSGNKTASKSESGASGGKSGEKAA